jgi:hypothetical protein
VEEKKLMSAEDPMRAKQRQAVADEERELLSMFQRTRTLDCEPRGAACTYCKSVSTRTQCMQATASKFILKQVTRVSTAGNTLSAANINLNSLQCIDSGKLPTSRQRLVCNFLT